MVDVDTNRLDHYRTRTRLGCWPVGQPGHCRNSMHGPACTRALFPATATRPLWLRVTDSVQIVRNAVATVGGKLEAGEVARRVPWPRGTLDRAVELAEIS